MICICGREISKEELPHFVAKNHCMLAGDDYKDEYLTVSEIKINDSAKKAKFLEVKFVDEWFGNDKAHFKYYSGLFLFCAYDWQDEWYRSGDIIKYVPERHKGLFKFLEHYYITRIGVSK